MVGQLIKEYGLVLTIKLVTSEKKHLRCSHPGPQEVAAKGCTYSQVVPSKERKAELLYWVRQDGENVLQRSTAGITWELRERCVLLKEGRMQQIGTLFQKWLGHVRCANR